MTEGGVSERGAGAPERLSLTRNRVEVHPGRGVRFEAQPLSGMMTRPWHVTRTGFVLFVLVSAILLGLALPWVVPLLFGKLTHIHLEVGLEHLAALWAVLGVAAVHLLTRRDQTLVTFESPSIITRRCRFGWWRHQRTPLSQETTRLKTVLTASAFVRGQVSYGLEIETDHQTVVVLEEEIFHRRAIWGIADRLADGLGVPLEDGLGVSKEVLVRPPEDRPSLPMDDDATLTLGLGQWRLYVLLCWGFSVLGLPPFFLILDHHNPDLGALVFGLGAVSVVMGLLAPFVLELRGFEPHLPQVLDPRARTLRVGSMLWPPRPHRLYDFDPAETYIVLNLATMSGHAARIYAYWHLGTHCFPIPIHRDITAKEMATLNVEAVRSHTIREAIRLADQVGVDIELVGHETIEAYEVYLGGLASEADG